MTPLILKRIRFFVSLQFLKIFAVKMLTNYLWGDIIIFDFFCKRWNKWETRIIFYVKVFAWFLRSRSNGRIHTCFTSVDEIGCPYCQAGSVVARGS